MGSRWGDRTGFERGSQPRLRFQWMVATTSLKALGALAEVPLGEIQPVALQNWNEALKSLVVSTYQWWSSTKMWDFFMESQSIPMFTKSFTHILPMFYHGFTHILHIFCCRFFSLVRKDLPGILGGHLASSPGHVHPGVDGSARGPKRAGRFFNGKVGGFEREK